MNIWMTNDLKHQFLTIGITACPAEWRLIDSLISQSEVFIETNWKSESMEKSNNPNIAEENLTHFKISIDNSIQSKEFLILIDDSMLIMRGSRESLITLKDLANDFGKDNASSQHIHLSYLEDSSYNWFSNKNVELILAVKSNS